MEPNSSKFGMKWFKILIQSRLVAIMYYVSRFLFFLLSIKSVGYANDESCTILFNVNIALDEALIFSNQSNTYIGRFDFHRCLISVVVNFYYRQMKIFGMQKERNHLGNFVARWTTI